MSTLKSRRTRPTPLERYTHRSSELSKNPAAVFRDAEVHVVTVTRRDGDPLVLMSKRAADEQEDLLDLAARIITAALDEGPLVKAMTRAFPWMHALSPRDRETCAQELTDAARASFSTGQPHLALAELTSWRETAEALAAGLGNDEVEWLDEPVAVERP